MRPTTSDEECLQAEHNLDNLSRNRGGLEIETSEKLASEENYDDEPDETFGERVIGLTEMFPEPLRNFSGALIEFTASSVKGLYKFSCNASWIFFTSSVILFAPVIFETERAQMEEMQKSQQKQVLLGPGSAMSAVGSSPELPLIR